tara:strand:- start:24355 stop:24936 length:582 start_codon:yes stop_codon:yes gene_type:complete
MKIICILLTLVVSNQVSASSIFATGRIESFDFQLESKSIDELSKDCLQFTRDQRIAHVDDIYVSFNGNKRLHLHNSDGMWHYPKHICAEFVKVATIIDLTPPTPSEFKEVEATISYKTFRFSGAHSAEIFNDCISQLENHRQRETDYIRVRFIDQAWKVLRNNDGWWRGAQQVCTLIDQALYQTKVGRAPALE